MDDLFGKAITQLLANSPTLAVAFALGMMVLRGVLIPRVVINQLREEARQEAKEQAAHNEKFMSQMQHQFETTQSKLWERLTDTIRKQEIATAASLEATQSISTSLVLLQKLQEDILDILREKRGA